MHTIGLLFHHTSFFLFSSFSTLPFFSSFLAVYLSPSRLHKNHTKIKQSNLIEQSNILYLGTKKFKTHQHSTIADRVFLAQKYHKIFHFFCGANGSLDVIDGVLTLLALALSREKNGGREDRGGEYGDRKKRVPKERCSNLTAADVAAVMAVVRGPQQRLILHER